MKINFLFATAAVAVALAASAAQAATDTVYNTELGPVVGGTTTTDATGTRSTNLAAVGFANETFAYDEWQARNLRGNGVAGITTDFARDGNGSAFFSTDGSSPSKADLEYYLSAPVLLSEFEGGTYDWFRDSASTVGPAPATSYRLALVTAQDVFAGYFVFEPYLNGTVPVDTWETETIDTTTSLFWSTNVNANLPGPCTSRQSCLYTIDALSAVNEGMKVVGFSTGAGSGWTGGTFKGGVDNFGWTIGGQTTITNFEVAAVPEPTTWALMIMGFGGAGALLRKQRHALVEA